MPRGIVKSFNKVRGFGFITVNGSQDIYFHVTDLRGGIDSLKKGDRVEFSTLTTLKAKEIVRLLEPIGSKK